MRDDAAIETTRVGSWDIRSRRWAAPAHAPAVVLVHGFVVSSRYLVPTGELLAPRFSPVAPDLPGFGLSSKPRDMPGIDALADALAAWMDARGLPDAHLLGNSMGCQVIAALAQRHPGRARSLVLVGPTVEPGERTIAAQARRLARDALRERASLPFIHVPDYVATGPRRILQLARHVLADRIEKRMPDVDAPTLILRGAQDGLVSSRFAERLAALAPDARVETLLGAPHAANYSAPRAVAARATEFFEDVERRSAERTKPFIAPPDG